MSRKIVALSLNEEQYAILRELMEQDHATNFTAFVWQCIVNEKKAREAEKSKRPVGRPRKDDDDDDIFTKPDFSDDLPKDIVYFGQKIGKKERDWLDRKDEALKESGMFQPKGG